MRNEEVFNVSFPIPKSLRDEMLARMETQSVETVNQRVVNAIKFAFTDNPIPFADEYDDEAKWATKEDVQCILEHISEHAHEIHNRLKVITTVLNQMCLQEASNNGLLTK